MITSQVAAAIEARWKQGRSTRAQIAAEFNLRSVRELDYLRETGVLKLPRMQGKGGGRPVGWRDPSPKEIEALAAEVRAKWSPFEELNRRSGPGRVLSDSQLEIAAPRIGRAASPRSLGTISGRR